MRKHRTLAQTRSHHNNQRTAHAQTQGEDRKEFHTLFICTADGPPNPLSCRLQHVHSTVRASCSAQTRSNSAGARHTTQTHDHSLRLCRCQDVAAPAVVLLLLKDGDLLAELHAHERTHDGRVEAQRVRKCGKSRIDGPLTNLRVRAATRYANSRMIGMMTRITSNARTPMLCVHTIQAGNKDSAVGGVRT